MERNDALVSVFCEMMGKDVTITSTDGCKYTGILVACTDEMEFGLQYAYEITPENEKNLLPRKSDLVNKMLFNFSDVVAVAARVTDDKAGIQSQKFATDRAYHGNINADEDLEEWNPEDDCVGGSIEDNDTSGELIDNRSRRNGNGPSVNGWSVDDMFKTNEKLNVVSNFKEDLSQYTTCGVDGATSEQRAEADRLAREIESSGASKRAAGLENDDVERDLDKETDENEFETVGLNHKRGGKNSAGFTSSQNRRTSGLAANGQPINRRADGLKSDRRNSGPERGGNQSRYANQSQGANTSQSSSKGQQSNNRRQEETPQHHNQSSSNQQQQSHNNTSEWIVMSKGKNSTNPERKYQPKEMLEPKANQKQQSEGERKGASKLTDLKKFADVQFVYVKESAPSSSASPPGVAGGASEVAGGAPRGGKGGPTTMHENAWTGGPPRSLLAKDVTKEQKSKSSVPTASTSSSVGDDNKIPRDIPQAADKASTSSPPSVESPPSMKQEQEEEGGQEMDLSMTQSTTESDGSSNTDGSKSFKFNVNAPEFKPRGTPATPQPGTPTGQMTPQIPVQPQQFVQEYGHPGQVHPAGPPHQAVQVPQGQNPQQIAMQGAQIVPGAPIMANNMNAPIVVWSGHHQMPNYQVMGLPVRPGQPTPMYTVAATTTSNTQTAGQAAQRRAPQGQLYAPQTWGNGQMIQMPQNPAFFQPQHQYQGQQMTHYQMAPQMVNGPPPQQQAGQGGYSQQQGGAPRYQQHPMYMTQGAQGQRMYQPGPPVQPHDAQFGNQQGAGGAPSSHPNSQPPTPGPQQQQPQPQQQQQPQTTPSSAQPTLQQGANSGSSGSLSGSAAGSQAGGQAPHGGQQRSVSPSNQQPQGAPVHQQNQPHQMMNMPPPQHQVQYVQINPQANPQMHPQMHQGPPGQHPQFYQPQPVYYQTGMVYQQHGIPMQGQHGQQMMGGEQMDGRLVSNFDQNRFGNYVPANNGNQYYVPPQQQQQQGAMSRQNSLPHQQGGAPSSQQQSYSQGGGPQQQGAGVGGQGPQQGMPPQQPNQVSGQ